MAVEDVGTKPEQTLDDQISQQYRTVCDVDLQSIRIERRKTTEYFELGRLATSRQEQLGYGSWGD